jgi:hypothetical protein
MRRGGVVNVTKIDSRTVKTYTLTIEDGEVRAKPYSRAGRQYRVERITVVKSDGNVSSVELSGSVLKNDGTAGLNGATERLYGHKVWPEWLHGVVGGLA